MRRKVEHKPVSKIAGVIGERIFQRRSEIGLTLCVLAGAADMSAGYLCDVENGKRRIGAERLFVLARILGVKIDWFFEQDNER